MRKLKHLERGVKSARILRVDTPKPQFVQISRNIELNTFQVPNINAIKFEVVFEAGRIQERQKLVSLACGSLLTEGTNRYSSKEISERVDYEGAYLSSNASADFITLKLVSSKSNFSKLLPLVKDILIHPQFCEEELNVFIQRRKQKLTLDLSKNDVVAYRALTESLYGVDSDYGYNSTVQYLEGLSGEELKVHFDRYCTLSNANFFISGDYSREHIIEIDGIVNVMNLSNIEKVHYSPNKADVVDQVLAGREKQASLKLGTRLFSRHHKDYAGLYFLNTILGGYFGSRLMKNIREEKGFTYNIYSMLDTYKYDGNWIIASEMNAKNVESTLEEIGKEFKNLREKQVDVKEIEMVRNYLLGNFISSINGPFKALSPFKTARIMDLGMDYYDDLFSTVQKIDRKQIQELANRYLHRDKFWKVIVGKE